MIKSIKINDNKKTPFSYLPSIAAFKNDEEFTFLPGVNVIIGCNGCGKTTLMNLIAAYMFCEDTMQSTIPTTGIQFPRIFDNNDNVYDGINIYADYAGKVFRLIPIMEMDKNSINNNINNFSSYLTGTTSSTGEKGIIGVQSLFNAMFNQDDYAFPIKELKVMQASNEVWEKRITNLLKYYKRNRLKISNEDYEFTVLMDEPDRNLDIFNVAQMYDILAFHKPQTQIIATIHNPLLIYKLSKLDCVNFIEMSNGYLDSILKFVRE